MEHLGEPLTRLQTYKEAGYDGIECANIGMDPEPFADACDELGLEYIAMMFCATEEDFRRQLVQVQRTRPVLVNCHPGRDHYDFERGCAFFRSVMSMAADSGLEVVYETHRTRCLYAPWTTARYLEAIPELRICADLSHFTTVAENPLSDGLYRSFMDIAIARTDHIHARVGHLHGPQVSDPRIGEGLRWTEHFEAWWDAIIEARLAEGREIMTVNPELGPPAYQPTHPVTGEPLSDIWECCQFIVERFRERWAGRVELS